MIRGIEYGTSVTYILSIDYRLCMIKKFVLHRFKIWHYSGTLLYERPWNEQEELWEVLWQTFPPDSFPEKSISYKAVEGIAPSQPQGNNSS